MSARFMMLLVTTILLASGRASAAPEFDTFEADFTQEGSTNNLRVSMLFKAFSPTRYLALGGGFTVRCGGSTAGQINRKNLGQRLGFGIPLQVLVPASPTTFGVPGFSNMQQGTCVGCTMTYVARAIDSFFEQAAVLSGEGAFFTLSPWQEEILVETNETSGSLGGEVCRGSRPQCCGPGCIPP
jgi:hypothetical protein